MNINEIPDSVLAAMVRNGCYAKGTEFSDGTRLVVLAMPYGPSDDVHDTKGAIEAFQQFISDYDWEERNFMVLTVPYPKQKFVKVVETSYETEAATDEDENELDWDPLYEN